MLCMEVAINKPPSLVQICCDLHCASSTAAAASATTPTLWLCAWPPTQPSLCDPQPATPIRHCTQPGVKIVDSFQLAFFHAFPFGLFSEKANPQRCSNHKLFALHLLRRRTQTLEWFHHCISSRCHRRNSHRSSLATSKAPNRAKHEPLGLH